MHDKNCFITLTYDDDHLPKGKTLVVDDFQRFMKRLRFKYPYPIRFFHCGEYGEKFHRPHYHAIIFGHDFTDKKLWPTKSTKHPIFTSKELSELWPLGHCSVGAVTFASAAYVARYITKKITGPTAKQHYQGRKPEYVTMSRRPGIAASWLEKYMLSDVYPQDFCVRNDGTTQKPPKYYDKCYELAYPSDHADLKASRAHLARQRDADNSSARMAIREEVQLARNNQLKRTII